MLQGAQTPDYAADSPRRRAFLRRLAQVTAAAVVASAVAPCHAMALPPLSGADPTAQALGYGEDSAQIDAARFPQHRTTQHCANCNFFQAGEGGQGSCQLFPGHAVNPAGWCTAYAAKAT